MIKNLSPDKFMDEWEQIHPGISRDISQKIVNEYKKKIKEKKKIELVRLRPYHIDGMHRATAYKQLGIKKIPVSIIKYTL